MCILMYMHSGYTNVMENQLEILDYILSAVVIINTEGKIVFVNDPFLELFQYKKEDIILAPFHVINNEYTEMFSHIEKYKVTENTRKYKNGDIVFEKPNQKL